MTRPKMDPADIVRLPSTWEALGVPKQELVEEESQFFDLLSVMWRTDPEMALLVASSRWKKTFVFETVSKLCSITPQCVTAKPASPEPRPAGCMQGSIHPSFLASAASRQPDPWPASAASRQPDPCSASAASSRLYVPQPASRSVRLGTISLYSHSPSLPFSQPASAPAASSLPVSWPATTAGASHLPAPSPSKLAQTSRLVGDSWTSSSLAAFLLDLPLEPESEQTECPQPTNHWSEGDRSASGLLADLHSSGSGPTSLEARTSSNSAWDPPPVRPAGGRHRPRRQAAKRLAPASSPSVDQPTPASLEPESPRIASSQPVSHPARSRPASLWPVSLEARLPPESSFEGSRLAIFSGSRGGHRRRPGHQQRPVCNQRDPRPASATSFVPAHLPDPRPASAASSQPDHQPTPVPSSV
ncbi:skin secretory protein xP2-like, partial [Micropterus dolomieu]|uniref:skin secretory protein xP2-like n=1 Tax=Micropterus dolomieu TaxID=147949 RepID=UPI001E8D7E92